MKTGMMPWKQRIKVRVLVFGILMSIIPILFISLTTFNTVNYKFKETIREQNLQRATVIASELQDSITNITESLTNLTHVNAIALIENNNSDKEQILNIVLRKESYLEDIKIIDKNLKSLVQVSRREVITDDILNKKNVIDPKTLYKDYTVSMFFSL